MNDTAAALRPLLRTTRILWAAILGTSVLFTVLGVVFPVNQLDPPPPATLALMVGMSLGAAVVSFVLPARQTLLLAQRRRPLLAPAEPLPGSPVRRVVFVDPLAAARLAFGAAQPGFILGMALSEVPCLMSFALHSVGYPVVISLPLGLLGIVLSALRLPTAARIVRGYEIVHGATFAPADLPG